jgi:hypothetical protein
VRECIACISAANARVWVASAPIQFEYEVFLHHQVTASDEKYA